MRTKSYRNRLIAIALLLFLAGQLLQLGNYYTLKQAAFSHSATVNHNNTFENTYNGIVSFLNDVELFAEYVCFRDGTDYVTRYNNVQDPAIADQLRASVDSQAKRMSISANMIEGYFLIGYTSLQRTYANKILSTSPEDQYPNFDHLSYELIAKSGILTSFKNSPFTFVAKDDRVRQQIQRAFQSDPKTQEMMLRFYEQIAGKMIYYSLDKGTFFELMVINDSFFVKYRDNLNLEIALVDQYDNVFWSSSNAKVLTTSLLPYSSAEKDIIKYSKEVDGQDYEIIKKNCGNYGLDIYCAFAKNSFLTALQEDFVMVVLLSVLCLLGMGVITFVASGYLVQPIKDVTQMIAAQIARKDYSNAESIPKIELNKYPWSFKKRLVLYFVGTVVIPTLAYGALVNHRLYVFSSGQTNIQFHYAAAQMENNLSYQVERLENIINVMTAPEVFKLLATKPTSLNSTEKEQIDKSLAKNSLTISNVKYFVLLGPGGTAKYQSLYSSNNSDIKNSNGNIIKFSLSNALISEYFENGQDMFWLESLKDIFNNPSLSLVRRITSVNDDKTTVGYFQMVLSSSVFQSVGKPFGYDFVITDAAGVPFYNSRNDSKYHNFILGMGQKQRDKPSTIEVIDGIKTMMVQEPVSKTDWKMCVFQRVDDLTAANMIMLRDSVLLTAAICLVIFLISLKLASLLAKPFNILQEDMQQVVNNKAFNQPLVYKGYSEMQDFIRMYNVMIRQIKQLIDDNIAISLREQEHITLKTQAELNMLQQQINPHFLYNTLEVINMQVKKSGELSASKMLEALAQIFRFSTRTDNKLVRLEQEIDHVKNYITIQMIRFENKFEVEYDIAEEALGIEVLKIILQPIVENAINHGLYEYITGGLLKISASITGDTLILSVRDNGIGMREPELAALRAGLLSDKTEAVKSKKGSGIALKNVYRRLDIYYAGKAKMTVESKFSKGTTVTIVIPIVHDTLENGTA